jgi:hypothetical protein
MIASLKLAIGASIARAETAAWTAAPAAGAASRPRSPIIPDRARHPARAGLARAAWDRRPVRLAHL